MATGGNRNDSDPACSSSTSISLLERARANDQGAWHRLVDLYGRLVYHWCRQKLPPGEIEDVYQEVFRAVAANLHAFRKERPDQSFAAWLLTIVNSKVADYFRRLNRQPKAAGGSTAFERLQQIPVPAEASPGSEDGALRSEPDLLRSALLEGAVDAVRRRAEAKSWQAFWLTVVEGRTASEAATELGSTNGAVRSAKSRILKSLRDELRLRLEELTELDDVGCQETEEGRADEMLQALRGFLAPKLAKT